MTSPRWSQVASVLAAALERRGEERRAYLDAACADDAPLREEVESLLAATAVTSAGGDALLPAEPRGEARTGQVLDGKYRLEKLLGRGGMGAVYLATHLGTDRPVALKLIAPAVAGRAEFVERFRREARAAGRLRHPGVVDVTDFGVATVGDAPFPYLVMEYLDGCSLADVLREEGRLPLGWTIDIVEQACSAIQAAHDLGILHRDLKPANLWLEPNRRGGFTVKVLDFGLAKMTDVRAASAPAADGVARAVATEGAGEPDRPPPGDPESETEGRSSVASDGETPPGEAALTRVGHVVGTPSYMSPEQCRGMPLDARSDVYSLGVVTYRLIAGQAPFTGDAASLLLQHVSAAPPPLVRGRGGVPAPVADLVACALAKDPEGRPRSAQAFASALRARAEGVGTLLQRVVVLLGERYPVLLRLSALAHVPLALVALGLIAGGQWLGPRGPVTLPTLIMARGLLVIAVALSALAASALCEAAVLRALVEPLRPVTLRPILSVLRRRLRAYAGTLGPFLVLGPYLVLVAVLAEALSLGRLPTLVLAAPAAAALLWAVLHLRSVLFLSSVIHVEGLSGRAALARSAALARRAVRLLPAVAQAALVTALLAGPVWASLAVAVTRLEGLASDRGWTALGPVTIAGVVGLLALPLLVLALPLFGVTASLLYFRAREAAGETLAEVLRGCEGVPAGATWRTRLQDRVREGFGSGV